MSERTCIDYGSRDRQSWTPCECIPPHCYLSQPTTNCISNSILMLYIVHFLRSWRHQLEQSHWFNDDNTTTDNKRKYWYGWRQYLGNTQGICILSTMVVQLFDLAMLEPDRCFCCSSMHLVSSTNSAIGDLLNDLTHHSTLQPIGNWDMTRT